MQNPASTAEVTIVTGSSRGIGLAIAKALATAGHRLVLVARDDTRLQALAADFTSQGHAAIAVAADLRDENAATHIVAAAERAFGPVTAVVNNAGTAPADKVENTPLALARACIPAMKRAGRGCLLQLASTAGLRGYPFTSAYTAAKHGMVGLSRALHAELSPAGIQVYAVCPGFVDSDITRGAAAAIAARGKTTADQAFARMAAQNRIGRMHLPGEVADATARLLRERPTGCVYELDRTEPAFVD